ncbi:MAG TPA: anthranilate synthase component I, partial [Trebonia sp.]|nr:anthranilate synthase component I [Trebonia sp.]
MTVAGGITITRTATAFDPAELTRIAELVDRRRGGVLSSGMEYPGRYTRWHLAYVNPPVEIACRGRTVTARALNERGLVLLPVIRAAMLRAGTEQPPPPAGPAGGLAAVTVCVPAGQGTFTEEERSRRPTVFSVLREITAAFGCADPHLGLYGAFGYDLAFQFEPVRLSISRPADQR